MDFMQKVIVRKPDDCTRFKELRMRHNDYISFCEMKRFSRGGGNPNQNYCTKNGKGTLDYIEGFSELLDDGIIIEHRTFERAVILEISERWRTYAEYSISYAK